jgi:uncharacterized protein YndB with AHSA1/START domain
MDSQKNYVTIETTVQAPIEKVWDCWTKPEHITKWNFASNDWCCPTSNVDLRVGGTFSTRMESKDGRHGFDFGGTYTVVEPLQKIAYTMGDGRTVDITFTVQTDQVKVVETFQAENTNAIEMQRSGWQSILNNFKKHVENS